MNNSKIALGASINGSLDIESIEIDENILPRLREKEVELVKIIETIKKISQTEEWSTLKKLIFDSLVESLDRRMTMETNKQPLDVPVIYSLQGQLVWARKYTDFDKLADVYRTELTNVRQQIKKYGQE